MQLKTLLQTAEQQLLASSATPALDAELLLAHVLHQTRVQLMTHPEQLVSADDAATYQALINRRKQAEPIAYIVGVKEFWSLALKVTEDTLIPRPETELLVELVLQLLSAKTPCHVADLGTGSGAIALALAQERPHWQLVATDNSAKALDVARENASTLQITNIAFYLGDWCHALPQQRFHAIVSNPPYLAATDAHLQGDIRHEPKRALVAAKQGLAALETIIQTVPNYLHSDGWLLVEHGHDQADSVANLLRNRGYRDIQMHTDLARIARVTLAQNAH